MRIRTKAQLLEALEEYPYDALVGIFGNYGSVPIEHISYYGPGENYENSPPTIYLWEDNYAGEDWEKNEEV